MDRQAREYLTGFGRAALLVRHVLSQPPGFRTPPEYVEDVACLHGDAEDLFRRGLAVGCLSALGR